MFGMAELAKSGITVGLCENLPETLSRKYSSGTVV